SPNPLDVSKTYPTLHILLQFNHRGLEARIFRHGQLWAETHAEVVLRSKTKQISFLSNGSYPSMDATTPLNPWKSTYQAVLRAEPHRVTMDVYHKRIRPFRLPLVQKEWRTCEENVFGLYHVFETHYAGYFSDLLIHDVETNPGGSKHHHHHH
uniref:Genome polyprotein n=1 Tax=Mengo encephalomyocarditis virus TaxID=12107 RepID=UPI001E1E23ED|nr:Chain A, Genome polyprotein [Mengo virus]7BNY_B Chain B, Genome polyprotein [Mengo virus]7BNY_C Chain C, Genome polyprotein [Mengo virus]7BNY_D Chain D, Genome polyprotein [Mengo virus]7NWT_AA Chain AA, Protein 2A [Mengo virus]7NWT_BB Chain BB, Protein 2A [Mengo virus]7NWT_CC Chain CC, Protein 2A [Mengo virus]